ncbi:MAG TPA: cyclic nucleotide-binding domain-containing protein [Thermoleophilaceae bacterium]|jgi:CRP-like cAMP-binding protein
MDQSRLGSIPLFSGLGKRELEALSRCADEVDVPEGKHLVEEGDFGHEFFAIEDGSAEVRHGDELLAQLGPGEFFGEQALSGDAQRNATVIATSPLTAVVMTRSAFRQMRREHPAVCERIEAAVRERGREIAQG